MTREGLTKLVELMVQVISASVSLSDVLTKADRAAFLDVLDERVHAAAAKRHFDAKVYFKGASKTHILSTIKEVLGEDERRRNAEKSQHDLAKFAVDSIAALGWLPPELRTASYAQPQPKAAAKEKPAPAKPTAGLSRRSPKGEGGKKMKVAATKNPASRSALRRTTGKGAAKRKSK